MVTFVLLIGSVTPQFDRNYWFAVTATLFGIWGFVAHGGRRITTLGLFNFASALFIGYSGMAQSANVFGTERNSALAFAIMGPLLAQMAITAFAWKRSWPVTNNIPPVGTRESSRFLTVWGLIILAVMFAAQFTNLPGSKSVLAEGVSFSAVALVAVGSVFNPRARILSVHILLAFGAFTLYAGFFHQGSGRLRIVALACTLAILTSARFPYRALKWLTVVSTPVVLWWLAQDRLSLQESLHAGSSRGRSGLESMLSPITTLARVFEAQQAGWPLRWGTTFFTLPFTLLPDGLRPEWQPQVLGYDLVNLTAPSRAGTGFSEASTAFGEWVWNFGVVGLILMVPFVAWALVWLDRNFDRSLSRVADGGLREQLLVVFFAITCGSVADLAWSGLHTYGARVLTRMPVLVALFIITSRKEPPSGSASASQFGYLRTPAGGERNSALSQRIRAG